MERTSGLKTVSVTELAPVVGEVVHVEAKENAVRLWFQGPRERFGIYVPDSVRNGVGTIAEGEVVEMKCEVGRFGLRALTLARVAAEA